MKKSIVLICFVIVCSFLNGQNSEDFSLVEKLKWFNKLDSIGIFEGFESEEIDSLKKRINENTRQHHLTFLHVIGAVYWTSPECRRLKFKDPHYESFRKLSKFCQGNFRPINFDSGEISQEERVLSFKLGGNFFQYFFKPQADPWKNEISPCNQIFMMASDAIQKTDEFGKLYYPDCCGLHKSYPGYIFYLKKEQVSLLEKWFNLDLIEFPRIEN